MVPLMLAAAPPPLPPLPTMPPLYESSPSTVSLPVQVVWGVSA